MYNLAKVFERVVYNQLKMILAPKISKQQHGFLSNRCIETNLMEFVTFIHDAFDKKCQVDVFYADVKKAFDSVSQPLLIRKMANYPIGNRTLNWLDSYSSERKQYVQIGSANSQPFAAHSAIAQGSICESMLFLAFFNDSDGSTNQNYNIGSKVGIFNFADDKKIATKIDSMHTHILQDKINDFVHWCDDNGLELNVAKCKIMTFSHKKTPIIANYTIKGQLIDRVYEMRDLGVIMDPKLSFHSHMEYVKKKADSMWAFARRECYKSFNMDIAKTLYGSLIRSNLEFASCIWSPSDLSHKNFIESTQRQAIIHINRENMNRQENGFVLPPYADRCAGLGLGTLLRRRVNASVLFIKKVISGQLESPPLRKNMSLNTGIRTFRNPEFIRLKHSSTDYGLYAPFNYACRAFNFAPLFIDPTLPFFEFRKRLLKLPDEAFRELTKLKNNQ